MKQLIFVLLLHESFTQVTTAWDSSEPTEHDWKTASSMPELNWFHDSGN